MAQRIENEKLFEIVKNFHEKKTYQDGTVQHPSLLPKLREYQEKAVQWMLHRERDGVIEDIYLDMLSEDGGLSGSSDSSRGLHVTKIPTGGILADEMGLGKTVEVLACLLNNPRVGVELPQPCPSWQLHDEDNDEFGEKNMVKMSAEVVRHQKEQRSKRAQRRAGTWQTDVIEDQGAGISGNGPSLKKTDDFVKKEDAEEIEKETVHEDALEKVEDILVKTDVDSNEGIPIDSVKSLSVIARLAKQKQGNAKKKKAVKRKAGEKKVEEQTKSDSPTSNPKRNKQEHSITKKLANQWYESKLAEVNKNPIRAYLETVDTIPDVQCICGEVNEDQLIRCNGCSRSLHKDCIGASKWIGSKPIYCPQCWLKQDPVQSRATLIVSPLSIKGQWLSEVKNHISKEGNFKVLEYRGVRKDGFSQPYDFCDYDLILTTYDILRRELDLADVIEGRRLRHEKRYYTPTCPLLCVDFWRVCLDEAQMIEATSTKAAEMVSRFTCVHRWAVTGTPIQKDLQDLYGLVMYLCVQPYSYVHEWKSLLYGPYCNGDRYPLYTLLAHIMWRSSKADVLDQIQIPPQTEQFYWLNFSPVEEHFYHRTHQECSSDFINRLSKFETLDISLQELRLETVNQVLAPLLKLRKACSHPQAFRGNIITSQKNTLTMEELLESLIQKTTIEAQEGLRKHIAALNGMAGLHIINFEYAAAAEKYREVLRIIENYKGQLKADTLQRLHTYHNLAEILQQHRNAIPPTLRDDLLCDEESKLEESYLKKAQNAVSSVELSVAELFTSVQLLENEISVRNDDSWWVDLCHSLSEIDGDELLRRVHGALLNHRKTIPELTANSIINRVSTYQGIKLVLLLWLEDIEKCQDSMRKSLKALQNTDSDTLVNESVDCHLRVSNLKSKTKSLCHLCQCENSLKKYETKLFDVKDKKQENIMVGDVYLLGQTKEGSWKPSEQETVLRTIISVARAKKVQQTCIKTGTLFIKLMDLLRKEFKQLRLLWSRINERTCAKDELSMCKLRLRLRFPDEPSTSCTPSTHTNRRKKETKKLSSNIDTKMENLHVIEPHKVEPMAHLFQLDSVSALSELKKKSGTLAYLQNLRSTKEELKENAELCPVCRSTLEKKWAVLSCGHCYCMDCILQLTGKKKQVQCAICRENTDYKDMSFVNLVEVAPESALDLEIPTVQGSHSTKIESVIKRLFYLRAIDPQVKVLIFSSWDKVLDILEEGLNQNGIKHVRLKTGPSYERSLRQFKQMQEEDPTTALMLPLKLGSKGLNLVEATHVMLVEPILNPADELQALGRVHRIGQTRPTYVHRFIIKETIEERMFSAVQATGKEQWSGKQVTLRQLRDLFSTVNFDYPPNVALPASASECSAAVNVFSTDTVSVIQSVVPSNTNEIDGSNTANDCIC